MSANKVVKGILSEKLGVDRRSIRMESRIGDDLGADSLKYLEIIIALESGLDIRIEDADAEKVVTVRDLLDVVRNEVDLKRQAKAA
ncbi:acyl carrier protein [Nitrosomonas marina]|uniref:Acyl carrier protein n=1 Tax=Nitrosomonas marina TaxID=917 RepID=A0A1H8JAV1_9PROT|nr:acyl carrier protein [Nitrosomonas marina]SEN77466.1 acyl carrier protein [Nitrosomonas marina]